MQNKWMAVMAVAASVWSFNASAQTVAVVTEESFPMSYVKDGKPAGSATQVVEQIFQQAGISYKIDVVPWARAVNLATTESHVAIYSLARTPDREPQYKWVGEIAPIKYSLYKLKSRKDVVIKSLEDAKKYRVGVVKDDLRAKYLIEKGFEPGVAAGLQEVANNTLNLKKLENGRIDVLPISLAGIEGQCNSQGFDCSQFEVAYDLELRTHLFLAFSKQTPDEVVQKARDAYGKLYKEGVIRKLLPSYWAGVPE